MWLLAAPSARRQSTHIASLGGKFWGSSRALPAVLSTIHPCSCAGCGRGAPAHSLPGDDGQDGGEGQPGRGLRAGGAAARSGGVGRTLHLVRRAKGLDTALPRCCCCGLTRGRCVLVMAVGTPAASSSSAGEHAAPPAIRAVAGSTSMPAGVSLVMWMPGWRRGHTCCHRLPHV